MDPDSAPNPAPTPQKAPVSGPRKRRRLLKVVLIAFGLLIVLLAAAPTLVGKLARGRIETVAREALEADVSIGDLSLGWTSGLEVGDVAVKPRADDKPGFSIGSITAKPTLSALLRGRVEVPDLVVKHVTLNLSSSPKKPEEKEEEEDEAEDETKPPKTVPDFGLRATIEDVTVVFRSPEWKEPVRVEHIGPVVISATSQDATHIDIAAGAGLKGTLDVLWAKDGKQLRRREHRLSGQLTLDRLDLASFKGAVAPWVEALSGVANGSIKIDMAGKALTSSGNLRIEHAAVAMRGAPDAHVLNDVTLTHDVRRDPASGWAGLVELAAAKGRIAPVSALGRPLGVERFDLKTRLSGNVRVAVERLGITADFGSVDATGMLATGKEPRSANAQIEARASLEQLAPWIGGLPDVTGAITSNAKIVLEESGVITVRGVTKVADLAAKDVPGVGALREKEIALKHDLDWGSDVLRMHDVAFTSSFLTAKCTGALQPKSGGEAPEGKIDVGVSANLDVIAGLLGDNLAIKPKGRLDAGGTITGAADGMAFDLHLNGEKIVLAGGPFSQAPLDLGKLQGSAGGRLASDRSRLDVPEWTLRSSVLAAGGKVAAQGLKDAHPKVNASVTATLMPDLLLPSVTATPPKKKVGTVNLAADVLGDDKAWTLTVTKLAASGLDAEGSFSYPHADVPSGAPQFRGKVSAVLERLTPLLSDTLQASGKVDADVLGSLGVHPGIDLNAHGQGLRFVSAEGATIAGDLQAIVHMEDTSRFNARLASPTLTFTDKERKSVAGAIAVIATGTYDQTTGAGEITSLSGNGPGATVSGSAAFSPGKEATFDLKTDLKMAEAAPVLAFFAPSVQASGTGTMTAKGRVSLKEGGGAKDSAADLVVKVDGLKTEALDLKNVDLKATLGGGIAKVEKATANLNGGTARLDANVDFRRDVPDWKGNFNLDRVAITKEMQPAIARAIPLFAGIAVTVTGVMGANLDLSGRGDNWEAVKPTLTGVGTVSSSGTKVSKGEILDVVGQFVGLPPDLEFEDFTTTFRVENGAVRQDRLLLSSAQVDFRMSGTTSFEGRLDYQLGIRPKGRSTTERWNRLGRLLDREGFLVVPLKGDVRHPSPKLPKLEDAVGGAAEDLLKRGLEDLLKKKKKN